MRSNNRFSLIAPAAAAAAISTAAVVIHLVARTTSGSTTDTFQFLGRFHPLAVHLPIGVLLLAALMEAASLVTRVRAKLDPAVWFVLLALSGSSLVGFVLGHMLARDGGYPSRLVGLHRSFALASVIGAGLCLVTWTWSTGRGDRRSRAVYRGALGATVIILTVGAHYGGSMTRGDAWLVQFAPAFVQRALGESRRSSPAPSAPVTPGAEPLVFRDAIQPVLRARCEECHGATKTKAGLRVDSLDALLAGGDAGPALIAHDPGRSLIVLRMQLPPDDDEHMPPDGREGPTPGELALIRWWIERGATADLRVRDALPPEASRDVLSAIAEGGAAAMPSSTATPSASSPTRAAAEPVDARAARSEASSHAAPAVEPKSLDRATRPVLGDDALVYRDLVTPILAARCGSCHGTAKQKGKLRLDALEAILRGGASGAAIVAGAPGRSSLVVRTRLPLDDELHMPPPRSPQPTPPELDVLGWWIAQGATPDARVAAMPQALRSSLAAMLPPPASTPTTSPTGVAAPAGASPTAATDEARADAPVLLPEGDVDLHAVVRRVLDRRCVSCHSDGGPASKLSFETHASILRGGKGGPVLIPGRPADSTMVHRMLLPLADPKHMPPSDEPQMIAPELDAITLWIERGAHERDVVPRTALVAAQLAMLQAALDPQPGGAPVVAEVAKAPPKSPERGTPEPVPAATGCASCAVGGRPGSTAPVLAVAALIAAALVRRTSRTRRRSPRSTAVSVSSSNDRWRRPPSL